MNQNQLKGSTKEAAGKLQRKLGELMGNTKQRIKGARKQAEGKAQKAVGNVEQDFDDMRDKRSAREHS